VDYCYENLEHNLIRLTDGDIVRFVPVDTANSEYRKLSEGLPAEEGQSGFSIPPAIITDPYLE